MSKWLHTKAAAQIGDHKIIIRINAINCIKACTEKASDPGCIVFVGDTGANMGIYVDMTFDEISEIMEASTTPGKKKQGA